MNTKRYTDKELEEHRQEYRKKYYGENKGNLLKRQESYRYVKSIQRIVDEYWSQLRKLSNSELRTWALTHGLGGSSRSMVSFWIGAKRNKAEGVKEVNKRVKEMNKFISNVQKRTK
jgi:hypothetical protein